MKFAHLCLVLLLGAGSALLGQGTDGLYATENNNYRIEVRFVPGKLLVTEPNKTSEYIQRGSSAVYEFTNPTNGISYVLEVASDGKGLKAYKPDSPQNFTPLRLVQAQASKASTNQPAAGVVKIPVQNPKALNPDLEELWGRHDIPGIVVTGR